MAKIHCKSSYLLRRDKAANWNTKNPILREGEEGYETDTGRRKVGNGTTEWNNLKYDSGIVDQTYTPDSENAQSGIAVAEALSGYVMAEVGKGLSSNDFTNEDKEKLYSALQNENIDKNYNPTSENAQSGLAVAQAVSTEQNRANSTFANALKGSASGSAILIDDVSPVTHEMGVKVRSKNLIPYPYAETTKTQNGITFTVNSDGSVTVSGTATAQAYFRLQQSFSLKKGQYFFSGCPTGGAGSKYSLYLSTSDYKFYKPDIGNGISINSEDDKTVSIAINIAKDTTVNNLVFKPQLELGTTATDYTPYVPDLTAVKLTRCGKNLLPYPYYETTKTQNGVTFTDNGDGSVTVNGTASSATVFQFYSSVGGSKPMNVANRTITISGCPSGGSLQSYFLLFSYGGNSYQDFGNGITKTPNADIIALQLRIAAGATVNNLTFRPQIELGATATDYEPYKECAEYTPNTDGTVEGVTSLYPNTTLMTDTEGVIIDCEYNRDINKAFAELHQAIISLGGNV